MDNGSRPLVAAIHIAGAPPFGAVRRSKVSGRSYTLALGMGSLAAGAIGSLITIAVAFFVWIVNLPRALASHDRRARERVDDLGQWTADRDIDLRRELEATRKALAAHGVLESGDYAWSLGLVKERALHEWRDQALMARRDIAAIYDREGLLHNWWRREPRVSLDATSATAKQVLDCWRTPSAIGQGRAAQIAPINDSTDRPLERVAREAPGRLHEYQ